MYSFLSNGIPKKNDYLQLIDSKEFNELNKFSARFISINEAYLTKYAKQWVKNPFHQWSRQWEYPYVFGKIESFVENKLNARLLDAGSGVTFFPYYIKSKFPSIEIKCTDQNMNLGMIFEHLNVRNEEQIDFSSGDLRKLPYPKETFDIVYCISVLEHTKSYAEIFDEIYKILQPGGKFIITFDVSIDGDRDISVEECINLLELLAKRFEFAVNYSDLNFQAKRPDVFTTISAREHDPSLLPWTFPPLFYQLKSLINGKGFISWPPELTIFCITATKGLG